MLVPSTASDGDTALVAESEIRLPSNLSLGVTPEMDAVEIRRRQDLVMTAVRRSPNYMTSDASTIQALFGLGDGALALPVSDLKIIVDALFVVNWSKTVTILDASSNVMLHRHKWNQRGDIDSVTKRKASIERVGVRQDIREPPWLMASANGLAGHHDLIHWATLLADATRAALKDITIAWALFAICIQTSL
jgi:hypothetical protein